MTAVDHRAGQPSAAQPRSTRSRTVSQRSRRRPVIVVRRSSIALVPLVLIVGYVVARGRERRSSWAFLTEDIPFIARTPGGGHGPGGRRHAAHHRRRHAMAVPLGVLGGIYLNEYGGSGPLARVIRFLAEVMTGVPSIVMGLFIYTVVGAAARRTSRLRGCARAGVPDAADRHPHDRRDAAARAGRAAGGQLRAREPQGRARSARVVLPAAAPGIVSGALLAVARAAGETAPLLFTIGSRSRTNTSLFNGTNTALSVQIFRNADSAVRRSPGPGLGRRAHADRASCSSSPISPGSSPRSIVAPVDSDMTAMTAPDEPRSEPVSDDRHDDPADVEPPPTSTLRRDRRPTRTGAASSSSSSTDVEVHYGGHTAVERRRPRHRRQRDHRVHRPVGLRQDHGAALPQPHARPHARARRSTGTVRVPRRGPLRPEGRRRRGAPPHRHGVPEAEPVPEVDLRQRRVRPAHQRRQARASSTTSSSRR